MRSADAAPFMLDAPLGSPSRPSWRGRLHLIALWSAIPALVVLAIESNAARSRAAVIVYAVGLCSMLLVSTIYHRWVHTIRARAAWRRADHATIFVAIAGMFSALALTSLDTGPAIAMLVLIWVAASVGAFFKIFSFHRANRLGVAMYIAIGWAGLALVPAVWHRGGVLTVGLMLAGGVMYTVGAAGFGRKWRTCSPRRSRTTRSGMRSQSSPPDSTSLRSGPSPRDGDQPSRCLINQCQRVNARNERIHHARQIPTAPRRQEAGQIPQGEARRQARQERDQTLTHQLMEQQPPTSSWVPESVQ